jgi:pimeloyl-ACP methyl ester carboxylesterase
MRHAIFLGLAVVLAGCQSVPPEQRLSRATAALVQNPSDARAGMEYRRAAAELLPGALREPATVQRGDYAPGRFAAVDPAVREHVGIPGLVRPGLGLPAVGVIRTVDPNMPQSGFRVPVTALVSDKPGAEPQVQLVDPERVTSTMVDGKKVPVAANFAAPVESARATGPRFGAGIRYLLRSDLFQNATPLGFLEPYDPDKTPVVFVHGLLSTPRMWEPVVLRLMANAEIRRKYQFWFFYYPTGQPVPLSALQLREALSAAVKTHGVKRKIILVGHSMGGILSRAQVSGITAGEAAERLPWITRLDNDHIVRRALIFSPRTDISRVIFLHTPHRGSRLAMTGIAGLGIQLIRLPGNLLTEMNEVASLVNLDGRGRLPTSIHGLSPQSPFLAGLGKRPPGVPHHTILGDRGRGDGERGSDGVVPYTSAHLDSALSEVVVPGGHGSFVHPKALNELERILLLPNP